ncbi:MAG: hypothetical protein DHS20C20_19020 [Ardenticatenaceae bacterium]|nr:MAG: hypothetical protein DHS20C20_19020 [Ardenticatenaceae bacterium]
MALFLCLLPINHLLAHGGGELKVGNAPIGRYLVSAWVNPPTVQAGQLIHVTVGIAQESNGEPVLDASVNVLIMDQNGATVETAVATTEQSVNRLFYEADLDPISTGIYEMQVVVTGNEGEGEVSFPLEVVPRSILPWMAGILAGLIVIGLVVRSWRRGDAKEGRQRRTAVPRRRSVD